MSAGLLADPAAIRNEVPDRHPEAP